METHRLQLRGFTRIHLRGNSIGTDRTGPDRTDRHTLNLFRVLNTVEHAALLTRGHVNRKKAGTYVRTVFSVRNLFLREKSSWQR